MQQETDVIGKDFWISHVGVPSELQSIDSFWPEFKFTHSFFASNYNMIYFDKLAEDSHEGGYFFFVSLNNLRLQAVALV